MLGKFSAKNVINEILCSTAPRSFTDEEDLLNSQHSRLPHCFVPWLHLPLLPSSFQHLVDLSGSQPWNDRDLHIISFSVFSFREDEYSVPEQKPGDTRCFLILALGCNGHLNPTLTQPLPTKSVGMLYLYIHKQTPVIPCTHYTNVVWLCEWALDRAIYE